MRAALFAPLPLRLCSVGQRQSIPISQPQRTMTDTTYTKEQLAVIHHEGGHAVVAAVAGSGKTETLIGRVRHLLRDSNPQQIAVVMFNKDAAQSFRDRFQRAVRGTAPEIRTFNSMGNKIINRFVQIGLLPDAEIIEKDFRRTRMAKVALTQAFKKLNGDELDPDKELVDGFINFLLLVKSDTHSPEEVFVAGKYAKAADCYPDAFKRFEKERNNRKWRFFEDQVYDPVKMMLRQIDSQRYVSDKVDFLIVDEAQDMNGIQIALLRILAGTRAKIMLVGDEDQCIYDWRGSKPDYLTRGFEKDFRNATRYTLPHTFRFGHALSLAASQLITRNANRNPKISISSEDTPKTSIECLALDHGLGGLGDHIKEAVESGTRPDDIAVLVRTYNLTVALELELHHHGIPYHVYGRPPLSRIPEIAALVGLLKLACGTLVGMEDDELQHIVRHLLQHPTLYLPSDAIALVIERALADPAHLSQAVRSVITPQTKPFQAEQIRDRADLLEIIAVSTESDALARDVLNLYVQGTRFEEAIKKQSPTVESAEAILANVAAFRLVASKHEGSISEFLDEIDPLIDSTNLDPPDEPHVWISSIHRAKGAQWPVVFVPGLVARSFPRDGLVHEQIEAERRLFYVAITRASQELYLAHPKDPTFSSGASSILAQAAFSATSPVSPFLWELDLALAKHAAAAIDTKGPFSSVSVDRPSVANAYFDRFPFAKGWTYSKREQPARSASVALTPSGAGTLVPGARVVHSAFGPGVVKHWVDARVVKVAFDSGDTRMLVASLAGLQIVQEPPSLSIGDFEDDEIFF